MRELLLASWHPNFSLNFDWLQVALSITIPTRRMSMAFYCTHVLLLLWEL